MHDVRLDVDALNWDQAELDSLVELVPPRTDDLVLCVNPNGTKSNPGW